ncbi:LLM class flavin-dependent oxidoreductase [Paeniglutamicibacter sp. ORCA_105]|uniref:LLM class flavin-dependent oxidoreductase n=1 Tax=Paeniglutamicibacter sp. ORCA_105 TaxID=3377336 RepID=UPI003894E79F
MKKIGFLTFGHSGGSTNSPVPTGADAVRQMLDLAVAAEESGFDGAWMRVHHFGSSLSTPFPLLAAIAAKTTTLEVGTGVIDMRYENPLYMAEMAGATDAISNGRLQLGISRGSPESARDGQHQFGYDLEPGDSWANETRRRAARFRAAIAGEGMAHPMPERHHDQEQLLPINPVSPGLENRIWWGAATIGSGLWTAEVGMNLLSSTLLLEDDGRPFHVLQADQLRQYRDAYAASGHTTGGMTAVTRSAFPITTDTDEIYFGRRERGDSVGVLDGSVARSGPTYAGAPEEVAQQFLDDDAITEADYVLFALPNQLGVDYNAHVMTEIAKIARELGWKE